MARGKKSKYQKKYKGVQYLAQRLHKYYPKRYTSYTQALPRAREILAELKESGTKVTWGNAQSLERDKTRSLYGDRYANVGRKPRKKAVKKPKEDPRELLGHPIRGTEGVPYFEEDSYIAGIALSSKKVWFTFDFIEDQVQGGTKLPYVGLFNHMVRYIDRYRRKEFGDPDSDNIFFVKFTTPTKSKSTGKLTSNMFIVDPLGEPVDVDIDPIDLDDVEKGVPELFKKEPTPTTKKEEKPLKTPETTSGFTPEQQIRMKELELQSQKMTIFKQLLDSGMSPKEAQKMIKDMFG